MEYRKLEAILADLHKVEPGSMKRFQARLRILQNAGVPRVQRVGKGGRVDYSDDDLWLSHFGLVLDQGGIPPSAVCRVAIHATILKMPGGLRERIETEPNSADIWVTVWFQHRGFSDEKAADVRMWLGTEERLLENMKLEDGKQSRAVMYSSVNASQITRDIMRFTKR